MKYEVPIEYSYEHIFRRAADAWRMGMEIFYRILPMIAASLELQSWESGRRNPLKKASGLKMAFLTAM